MGYRDYVPEKKDSDKMETLDEVINRLNALIRKGQFEGRILSVECLPCEATGDFRFDPEVWLTDQDLGMPNYKPNCFNACLIKIK